MFDAVDKYENCERLIQTYAEEVLYNINKRHENTISANASKFTTVKFGNRTIADRSLSIDKYISILKKLKDSITKITSPFLARIKKVKFNISSKIDGKSLKEFFDKMNQLNTEINKICNNEYDRQVYTYILNGEYEKAFQVNPSLLSEGFRCELDDMILSTYATDSNKFKNMINGMLYMDNEHYIFNPGYGDGGYAYGYDYLQHICDFSFKEMNLYAATIMGGSTNQLTTAQLEAYKKNLKDMRELNGILSSVNSIFNNEDNNDYLYLENRRGDYCIQLDYIKKENNNTSIGFNYYNENGDSPVKLERDYTGYSEQGADRKNKSKLYYNTKMSDYVINMSNASVSASCVKNIDLKKQALLDECSGELSECLLENFTKSLCENAVESVFSNEFNFITGVVKDSLSEYIETNQQLAEYDSAGRQYNLYSSTIRNLTCELTGGNGDGQKINLDAGVQFNYGMYDGDILENYGKAEANGVLSLYDIDETLVEEIKKTCNAVSSNMNSHSFSRSVSKDLDIYINGGDWSQCKGEYYDECDSIIRGAFEENGITDFDGIYESLRK